MLLLVFVLASGTLGVVDAALLATPLALPAPQQALCCCSSPASAISR
jgi:hypothetical protein